MFLLLTFKTVVNVLPLWKRSYLISSARSEVILVYSLLVSSGFSRSNVTVSFMRLG